MNEFSIRLSSVEEINQFIRLATLCPCDVHISSGTQTANAKAYMGVFSLDFGAPLQVTVRGPEDERDSFRLAIEPYIIEPELIEKG